MTTPPDNQDNGETEKSTQGGSETATTCMICIEEWTIGTDHRVCCLKCGHLFGRSCIEKWIKEKGSDARCPSCQKPAKKADLRNIWCKSIVANDTTELEHLRKELETERRLRKTDATILFHNNMRIELLQEEIGRKQREIEARDKKIAAYMDKFSKLVNRTSNAGTDANEQGDADAMSIDGVDSDETILVTRNELKGHFLLGERVETSATGGCKAFALCPTTCVILVGQPNPSSSSAMFGKFGLRKYSIVDSKTYEFVPLHARPITSVQLKPYGDLILTASQDRKVKITSITNNICITDWDCEHEPTCVAWSAHRDQQLYVGTGNCYVTLYDLRKTGEYIYQSPQRVAQTRLLSIAAVTGSDNTDGLLVNDIKGSQFIELSQTSSFSQGEINRELEHMTSHSLPFEGMMGTVDFDRDSGLSLVSTRRSQSNPGFTHNLVKLTRVPEDPNDESKGTKIDCTLKRSFASQSTPEMLCQSRILRHPTLSYQDDANNLLVGASDKGARGVKLWDASDNSVYQNIETNLFIRDMALFKPEQSNQYLLYLLNDKGMLVYRWDYA